MLSIGISGSLYLFFDVAQLHFKEEAKDEVASKENLQTIKLSVQELNSHKDGDELWVNGQLYDVSGYIVINDTAIVTVFHDKGEEGVIKAIVDSFEPNDKYSCDNITHVSKHRIHPPSDGKVLVARYEAGFAVSSVFSDSYPFVKEYCHSAIEDVIKPPPRSVIG